MKISIDQTNFIKGIGILLIMFHNFFHWMSPWTGENEFDFELVRVQKFWNGMVKSPENFINTSLSFFGHYGVQIFVILSGYGLAMKYIKSGKKINFFPFITSRLSKIYTLFIIGAIIAITYNYAIGSSPSPGLAKVMAYKFLFIHTLIPGQIFSYNGPWWFFALIVQLYLFFPLLFNTIKKKKDILNWKHFAALLIVFYILYFVSYILYFGFY